MCETNQSIAGVPLYTFITYECDPVLSFSCFVTLTDVVQETLQSVNSMHTTC